MAENSNTPARTTSKAVAPTLKAPDSSLHVAKDLANFIKANKLSSNIQGKEYVQVEGWQFAGSRLGIVPILGEVTDLTTDQEIRFRARVSLYDLHNKMELGGGVAECSNKERSKKFYESYAICSMAQTRAVGKAYRNVLAWLIKAAGFEATPWEEMVDVVDAGTGASVVEEPKPMRAVTAEQPEPLALPEPAPMVLNADFNAPAVAEPLAPAANNPAYATAAQKEELIRLLDSSHVTRTEKTSMMLNINKLSVERMNEAIAKLKKTIQDREQQTPKEAAPGPVAAPSAEKGSQPLSRHQREDLIWLINRPAISLDEKKTLRLEIGKYTRQQAEAKKTELRQLIAEHTPNEVVPAVLAGEDFTAAAKALLDFTRKNADVLGHEAYEDAYLHVQGQTVTAAELRASLQRHQDAFEALAA